MRTSGLTLACSKADHAIPREMVLRWSPLIIPIEIVVRARTTLQTTRGRHRTRVSRDKIVRTSTTSLQFFFEMVRKKHSSPESPKHVRKASPGGQTKKPLDKALSLKKSIAKRESGDHSSRKAPSSLGQSALEVVPAGTPNGGEGAPRAPESPGSDLKARSRVGSNVFG